MKPNKSAKQFSSVLFECANKVKALVLMRPAWIDQPMPGTLAIIPYIADTMERFGSKEGLKRFKQSPQLQEIIQKSS